MNRQRLTAEVERAGEKLWDTQVRINNLEHRPRMLAWEDVGAAAHVPFSTVVSNLKATYILLGYWRLGEAAEPFADTSGYPGPAKDAHESGTSIAVTKDVAGALPAADDDGAVRINESNYLTAPEVGTPAERRFEPAWNEPLSVAAWVKPLATTRSFNAPIAGAWGDAGFGNCGWVLLLQQTPDGHTVTFARREYGTPAQSAFAGPIDVAQNAWAFVAGTFSGTSGVHKLYVNGELAFTVVNDQLRAIPTFNAGVAMGGGSGTLFASTGAKTLSAVIDEVTVWKAELSAADIAALYEAGRP